MANEPTHGKNELKLAEAKIRSLEKRLEELENRLPKQYDVVKFLNYQNRKRILVSESSLTRRQDSRVKVFLFSDNGWSWFRGLTSCGHSDEART